MSTPVQRQFWELKNQNPQALLFFRLGDFYELFFEDAEIASRLLGIALTARHKGSDNEMPMCGFPHHAHQEYLEKLVESGYSVAVAEQVEENGVIRREIDRLITPGTTIESGNHDDQSNRYLACVGYSQDGFALCYSDLSTGEIKASLTKDEINFWDELYKINAKEILVTATFFENESLFQKLPKTIINKASKEKNAANFLADFYQVQALDGLGFYQENVFLEVITNLLQYLQKTQNKEDLNHLQPVAVYTLDQGMRMDVLTLRHLEIFQSLSPDNPKATLWHCFERPFTAMGGRRLKQWLLQPLTNEALIKERQIAVDFLLKTPERHKIQECLGFIYDTERLLTRLSLGRGNARDIRMVAQSVLAMLDLQPLVNQAPDLLYPFPETKASLAEVTTEIAKAIKEQPSLEITQGGIINTGYCPDLELLANASDQAGKELEALCEKEKNATGIATLRVKYSKNFGYCFEIPKSQQNSVPDYWQRRQTLVNAERYTSADLSTLESVILGGDTAVFEKEYQIFVRLRDALLDHLEAIQQLSQHVSVIDACASLAQTAEVNHWVCPSLSKNGGINIINGRHPIVENISDQRFIANNLQQKNGGFHLITGPNMAGKSTYLRQSALILYLHQMGSYVPAEKAVLPVTDQIFTRVGASDNLAGGQSTFFVEMMETARILNRATKDSFVILDEIGRGTSTFDGLSLAWAISEYLHNNIGAKTLFATHYHELIQLADDLPKGQNFHVRAQMHEDQLVFFRKIENGGVSDSFGIEVAKEAGIPAEVINGSRTVLQDLENKTSRHSSALKLFDLIEPNPAPEPEMLQTLKALNLEALTPLEALNTLQKMQTQTQKENQ